MFYSFVKKSDGSIVESGCRDPWDEKGMLSSIATNYGGSPSDYAVYSSDNSSEEALRVMAGDAFDVTLDKDTATALDFTKQDSKLFLRFSTDAEVFMADGADQLTIIAELIAADRSTPVTDIAVATKQLGTKVKSATDDMVVLFTLGNQQIPIKFTFDNGVATKIITTTTAGVWRLTHREINGYRVESPIEFYSAL